MSNRTVGQLPHCSVMLRSAMYISHDVIKENQAAK